MYVTGSRTPKQKRFEVSIRNTWSWAPVSSHRWAWVARLEALGWEDARKAVQIIDTKTGELLMRTEGDDV